MTIKLCLWHVTVPCPSLYEYQIRNRLAFKLILDRNDGIELMFEDE